MFDPSEESMVLDIVSGIFDVPGEEMMKIGDLTKRLLFGPGVESREAAVEEMRAALKDMPKEHALIAGVFISGLLRCNLSQQMQQQMQGTEEGCQVTEDCQKSD